MTPRLAIAAALLLAACGKKAQDAAPAATTPDPSAATAAAPAAAPAPTSPSDSTDAQREAAQKQAAMDYASMEDRYLNDPAAQWAATATASSTFGAKDGEEPSSSVLPKNATGAVDGEEWTNNSQDVGFDWLETTYAKPVNATGVRVVFKNGQGIEAVNKVEVQGTDGKWNTVWSGISDQKPDERGSRSWFVRTFDKTPYLVKAVKITLANNVQRGYKVVDAVQLIGG